MFMRSWTRWIIPVATVATAAALGGCVAYPYPYSGGYYGGGYYSAPYAYAYAPPPPVIGFNFGWWGGWHHHDWH